jgi:predicted transposase YbfD/YdcC
MYHSGFYQKIIHTFLVEGYYSIQEHDLRLKQILGCIRSRSGALTIVENKCLRVQSFNMRSFPDCWAYCSRPSLKGNLEKAILEETPEESWSVPTSISEVGHGRIETRTIRVAPLAPGELDFPGARSIAIVKRSFIDKKSGKESKETIGYISSLVDPAPRKLLTIIRSHWTIENSFFHVRDRTYREDQQLTRTGNGPTNLALFRNLSISINNLLGKKPIQELQAKVNRDPASFLAKFKLTAPLAQL